jgi:hypothetical protein
MNTNPEINLFTKPTSQMSRQEFDAYTSLVKQARNWRLLTQAIGFLFFMGAVYILSVLVLCAY